MRTYNRAALLLACRRPDQNRQQQELKASANHVFAIRAQASAPGRRVQLAKLHRSGVRAIFSQNLPSVFEQDWRLALMQAESSLRTPIAAMGKTLAKTIAIFQTGGR